MASLRSAESLAALVAASASVFSAASSALRSEGDIFFDMRDDQPMQVGGCDARTIHAGPAGIKKPARRVPAGAVRPIAFRQVSDLPIRVKRHCRRQRTAEQLPTGEDFVKQASPLRQNQKPARGGPAGAVHPIAFRQVGDLSIRVKRELSIELRGHARGRRRTGELEAEEHAVSGYDMAILAMRTVHRDL